MGRVGTRLWAAVRRDALEMDHHLLVCHRAMRTIGDGPVENMFQLEPRPAWPFSPTGPLQFVMDQVDMREPYEKMEILSEVVQLIVRSPPSMPDITTDTLIPILLFVSCRSSSSSGATINLIAPFLDIERSFNPRPAATCSTSIFEVVRIMARFPKFFDNPWVSLLWGMSLGDATSNLVTIALIH